MNHKSASVCGLRDRNALSKRNELFGMLGYPEFYGEQIEDEELNRALKHAASH